MESEAADGGPVRCGFRRTWTVAGTALGRQRGGRAFDARRFGAYVARARREDIRLTTLADLGDTP
ncbi:hypothetical protein ABZZ17_03805, partial [Streptomyces sp. NPDC006512]